MKPISVIVHATGLTKSFHRGSEEVHAVRDADLEILSGELVALVGPSGSGKTTILNLLAGWEQPDAGVVRVSSWTGALEDVPWDRVAVVPQTVGLLTELTIRENVELPLRLGYETKVDGGRVNGLLEDLGLDHLADRSPDEVSLGEQQRAAIARALVRQPALLLTDEPSGHQDAIWTRRVFRSLRVACQEGTACLVATHNSEVLTFVDRILEMSDGLLAASDAGPKESDAPL